MDEVKPTITDPTLIFTKVELQNIKNVFDMAAQKGIIPVNAFIAIGLINYKIETLLKL